MHNRTRYLVATLFFVLSGCNSFNEQTYVSGRIPEPEATSRTDNFRESGVSGPHPYGPADAAILKDLAQQRAKPSTPPAVASPASASSVPKAGSLCPPYHPPVLPPPPSPPIKELELLAPTDTNGIELLARSHISDLHKYIRESRAVMDRSYRSYMLKCQDFQKSTDSKKAR